jgi:hypothetical protein
MSDRRLAGEAGKKRASLYHDRPAGAPARPAARKAKVEIHFGEVEIVPPANEKDRGLVKTVRLRLVDVRGNDAPEGAEPLH